ncbi:MAG: hypothetical protein WD768_18425 [Phycisphaeraceae bacterium]
MRHQSRSGASMLLAAGALLLAGYWLGASQPASTVVAQDTAAAAGDAKDAAEAAFSSVPMGVSIPNGGAAVVKGRDGYAYIVDSRGIWVRAAQSGKPLPLP